MSNNHHNIWSEIYINYNSKNVPRSHDDKRDLRCENTSLQNVELENYVLSYHIIVRYR